MNELEMQAILEDAFGGLGQGCKKFAVLIQSYYTGGPEVSCSSLKADAVCRDEIGRFRTAD